jgi:hypothetical protein
VGRFEFLSKGKNERRECQSRGRVLTGARKGVNEGKESGLNLSTRIVWKRDDTPATSVGVADFLKLGSSTEGFEQSSKSHRP